MIRYIVFADTWDELNLKAVGLHHDRCYHIFRGKTEDICDNYKYKDLMVDEKEFCFIYEEPKPYIPKENE